MRVGIAAIPKEIIQDVASGLDVDEAKGLAQAGIGLVENGKLVEIVFGDEDDSRFGGLPLGSHSGL